MDFETLSILERKVGKPRFWGGTTSVSNYESSFVDSIGQRVEETLGGGAQSDAVVVLITPP
jgi:hypothetical protein